MKQKLENKIKFSLGSGLPLREFMHVDDLGDAVVFALEKWDHKQKNAPRDNRGLPLTF